MLAPGYPRASCLHRSAAKARLFATAAAAAVADRERRDFRRIGAEVLQMQALQAFHIICFRLDAGVVMQIVAVIGFTIAHIILAAKEVAVPHLVSILRRKYVGIELRQKAISTIITFRSIQPALAPVRILDGDPSHHLGKVVGRESCRFRTLPRKQVGIQAIPCRSKNHRIGLHDTLSYQEHHWANPNDHI